MARVFLVRIDIERLRLNLSRQEGVSLTGDEVDQWLRDAGFTPLPGEVWRVLEPDLGQLETDEVTGIEEVEPPEE